MNKAYMEIGIGSVDVEVKFQMSSEGDVEDMLVYYSKLDITDCLSTIQLDEIADKCYFQYMEEAKENNLDIALMRKESCE